MLRPITVCRKTYCALFDEGASGQKHLTENNSFIRGGEITQHNYRNEAFDSIPSIIIHIMRFESRVGSFLLRLVISPSVSLLLDSSLVRGSLGTFRSYLKPLFRQAQTAAE